MSNQQCERKLRLTGDGMANISASKSENDFTFIVGDNRYHCPWFVAAFLSPRIGRIQSIDPTFCEFVVGTSDSRCEFSDFLSLGRGRSISLTSSNRGFLLSVAAELENFEIYWQIEEELVDSVSFYSGIEELKSFESAPVRVISFIASHLSDVDRSFVVGLPISTLC
jgi:hypothetical protein